MDRALKMKFVLWSIFFVLFFQNSTSQAKTLEEVYNETSESVVYVFSGGGLCAGTLISDTLILTAWHCVNRIRPITIGFKNEDEEITHVNIAISDTENDLVILKLDKPQKRKPVPILDSKEKIKEGQPIMVIGHPYGISRKYDNDLDPDHSYVLTKGIVSKVGQDFFTTDASADRGNSGGPILNEKGELIGVSSLKWSMFLQSPNHEKINNLVQKLKTDPPKYPGEIPEAEGNSYTHMYYVHDTTMDKLSGGPTPLFGMEMGYTFFDRIPIALSHTFFRPEYMMGFSFGYHYKTFYTNTAHADFLVMYGPQEYFRHDEKLHREKITLGFSIWGLWFWQDIIRGGRKTEYAWRFGL